MSERFEMRVPAGWVERLDARRGQVSRAAFVKAAVERAMAVSGAGPTIAAPAGLPERSRNGQARASDSSTSSEAPKSEVVPAEPSRESAVRARRLAAARSLGLRPASSLEAKQGVKPRA